MKAYTGGVDLPLDLNAWTPKLIRTLAEMDGEPEGYDFKGPETLHPKAPDKGSLGDLVCALANHRGGFIILGVTDRPPREIKGIDPTGEIHHLFAQRISVEPLPEYEGPHEIRMEDGALVFVVHVPPSRIGPHWSPRDSNPFRKRKPGGTGGMAWHEIRDKFLQVEVHAAKAELLSDELARTFQILRHYPFLTGIASTGRLNLADMPERLPVEHIRQLADDLILYQRGEAGLGAQTREALRGAIQRMEAFNARYTQVMLVDAAQAPVARRWAELVADARGVAENVSLANATFRMAANLPAQAPLRF